MEGLTKEEVNAVISYWQNKAIQLESKVIELEISLNRAKQANEAEVTTDQEAFDTVADSSIES